MVKEKCEQKIEFMLESQSHVEDASREIQDGIATTSSLLAHIDQADGWINKAKVVGAVDQREFDRAKTAFIERSKETIKSFDIKPTGTTVSPEEKKLAESLSNINKEYFQFILETFAECECPK